MAETKRAVKRQFGDNAIKYVSSPVHAKGQSLDLLLEVTQPQPDWVILDVATGGGHNALSFAKSGASVMAGDLTLPMIRAARSFHVKKAVGRVSYAQFDAEWLPFTSRLFDCVTSRIAAHHFPDVMAFISESARVLKPGGLFAISDNVAPEEQFAAIYLNAFEQLRDPSHSWAYSVREWTKMLVEGGFEVEVIRGFRKDLDFLDWSTRMTDDLAINAQLEAMIENAPQQIHRLLGPRRVSGRLVFSLEEAVIVGRKSI